MEMTHGDGAWLVVITHGDDAWCMVMNLSLGMTVLAFQNKANGLRRRQPSIASKDILWCFIWASWWSRPAAALSRDECHIESQWWELGLGRHPVIILSSFCRHFVVILSSFFVLFFFAMHSVFFPFIGCHEASQRRKPRRRRRRRRRSPQQLPPKLRFRSSSLMPSDRRWRSLKMTSTGEIRVDDSSFHVVFVFFFSPWFYGARETCFFLFGFLNYFCYCFCSQSCRRREMGLKEFPLEMRTSIWRLNWSL